MCELKGEEYSIFRLCLHFPELAIDICLVEALGHKLSAQKSIPIYMFALASSMFFTFSETHKNPCLLGGGGGHDDDTVTAAVSSGIAHYHAPDNFPSTLQSLTYLILQTTL